MAQSSSNEHNPIGPALVGLFIARAPPVNRLHCSNAMVHRVTAWIVRARARLGVYPRVCGPPTPYLPSRKGGYWSVRP